MVKHMDDIKGKACVVTGATAGMGLYTAKELAKKGAVVIGTGRNAERCEKARREVLAEAPEADVTYLTADLASQGQIRRLASDILEILDQKTSGGLYCLVNNAGTFASKYTKTEDGVEMQLAVNFIAPFLLTHLLFPALLKCPGARVLTVSSESHYKTPVNWKNPQLRHCYVSIWAYKQSKLFTVLFMRALDRRVRDKGVRAFAVDPGLVSTDIGFKDTDFVSRLVWHIRKKMAVPIAEGAATSVLLACGPVPACEEVYWRECRECRAARNSYSGENMRRVWEIGEKFSGVRSGDYGI